MSKLVEFLMTIKVTLINVKICKKEKRNLSISRR